MYRIHVVSLEFKSGNSKSEFQVQQIADCNRRVKVQQAILWSATKGCELTFSRNL